MNTLYLFHTVMWEITTIKTILSLIVVSLSKILPKTVYVIRKCVFIPKTQSTHTCNSFHWGWLLAFERPQSAARDKLTFLSIPSPTIACLAITHRAKLDGRRWDIGFEPNSCFAFVNSPDTWQNVEESKWCERLKNGYLTIKMATWPSKWLPDHQNEIPLDVAAVWGQ